MTGRQILRRGEPFVWLAGSALGICILMVAALLWVIVVSGLGHFWPRPVVEVTLDDGSVFMGEVSAREAIPIPGEPGHLEKQRIQLRVGNRDLYGFDFKWIREDEIVQRQEPPGAHFVERREYGPLLATPVLVREEERTVAEGPAAAAALPPLLRKAARDRAAIRDLERGAIGEINHHLEQARLRSRALDLEEERNPGRDLSAERGEIVRIEREWQAQYEEARQELETRVEKASRAWVVFETADGQQKEIRALDVFRAYPANGLSLAGRARVYASRLWEFLSGDPRESNTEGGIFPAIFGTVMMVMIMSAVGVPFGVVAALYMREYAGRGPFVRALRIAVNNLAGVPSIVFGVFGLGFFIYFVGGGLDHLFFRESLPTPTFGTGGILWASLTLALLTVPVVIVSAEEALAAVPRSMREASLAMGATKLQTILRIVLPAAAPGILTGFILAVARGAGEVAPLMLTGVVKLAPELPVDGRFPFFHLDRKFMHLGFHIYDVGFQSPNVEAAKPMVFTTALLLLAIVLALNILAIVARNRLRERYKTGAF